MPVPIMFDTTSNSALTNQLLEIVRDSSLRRDLEQSLGDYCHQFRNRLNSLKLSIYLAKRQVAPIALTCWRFLETTYQLLEEQLGRVQLLCRPLELTPVLIDLTLLFQDRRTAWSQIMTASGRTLEFAQPDGKAVVRFDVNQLGQALDSLVVWRAEQGNQPTRTVIAWWVEFDQAHVTWTEGPGVNLGQPITPRRIGSPGTIPILTRIINEHGGQVRVNQQAGWNLAISWPATCTNR